MIRLCLWLPLAVLTSYSVPSAAMIEKVTTTRCIDGKEHERSNQLKAEIAGAEKALSNVALFCQDKFATLRILDIRVECTPSSTKPDNRILCSTCLTTVTASCD